MTNTVHISTQAEGWVDHEFATVEEAVAFARSEAQDMVDGGFWQDGDSFGRYGVGPFDYPTFVTITVWDQDDQEVTWREPEE